MVPIIKSPHELRHPNYVVNQENWRKWRLAYEGGDRFIRQYLKRMSRREGDVEYAERLAITYCPAFAKAAIRDVVNSIYARFGDITRVGGSQTYTNAVAGLDFGIDFLGNSMNSFMARRILPELLTMGRVGIYVDMPPVDGPTKAHAKGKRPYIYWYRAEDILSWEMDAGDRPNEFTNILLGDTTIEDDPDAFLPTAEIKRFRHLWIGEDGYVWAQFYDLEGKFLATGQSADVGPVRLDIKRIPFVMLDLSESLMMDIANYQIALLNLASSDMNYAIKANFPFYVEQFDNRTETPNIKSNEPNQYFSQTSGYNPATGSVQIVNQESGNVVRVGTAQGRKYPIGTNQPAFIHPSSEPLEASMKKQAQLKAEIRELINLAITNLTSSGSDVGTAELGFDQQSLESGLAYIGLELEIAERKIAEFFAMYEGSKTPANVYYPKNYTLTTEEERLASAKEYIEILPKLPSKTFQKEIAKAAIKKILEHKVPQSILAKMYAEIDAATILATDPEVILSDFTAGFVGLDTASKARGYPEGEVEKAQKDHADRVARIAIAQSEGGGAGAPAKGDNAQARGTGELGADASAGKKEKAVTQDNTTDESVASKTRGEGK